MIEESYEAWAKNFDDRQKKEIEFAMLYAKDFAHGTDGHNSKLIIAKMADLLTEQAQQITDLLKRQEERASTMKALQDSPLANLGK